MQPRPLILGLIAAAGLGACKKPAAAWFGGGQPESHGRYQGVGLYSPSQQWTRIVGSQQAKDTPAAKPIDDQVIVVVEDSVTGEVRACGDLTGYCIGMNPWKSQLTAGQIAPINLTEHVKPPEPADETAAPAPKPRSVRHGKPAAAPPAESGAPPSE
jgi:hypothetical protein